MAQYVTFDPKAEVSGRAALLWIGALGDAITPIMAARHQIAHFDSDQWLSMQANLDVFKEISSPDYSTVFDNTVFRFVQIGMRVPDFFDFPAEIKSIPSALLSLNGAYHRNHRGGEVGFYRAVIRGESQIDMVCYNPYPCDFDYGIIYGMVQRFHPDTTSFSVHHDETSPCRKKGGEFCIYHVTWEEIEPE
jgi:hypothetical protein